MNTQLRLLAADSRANRMDETLRRIDARVARSGEKTRRIEEKLDGRSLPRRGRHGLRQGVVTQWAAVLIFVVVVLLSYWV